MKSSHICVRRATTIAALVIAALASLSAHAQFGSAFTGGTYELLIQVPVNLTKLSPNLQTIGAECDLFDASGKKIEPGPNGHRSYPSKAMTNVPFNRAYQGVFVVTWTFDMATAVKIDWGTYRCNVWGDNGLGKTRLSLTAAKDDFRVQPGAVLDVSGSLN